MEIPIAVSDGFLKFSREADLDALLFSLGRAGKSSSFSSNHDGAKTALCMR